MTLLRVLRDHTCNKAKL